MITLRLDPTLEDVIDATAKNLGVTKSDLIRKSIVEYLNLHRMAASNLPIQLNYCPEPVRLKIGTAG